MRDVLIAVAILVLSVSPASSGGLFELGVKAGANVTNPRGLADGITGTGDFTFMFGAIGQVGLGDLLSVGAELVYEGRRFVLTTTVPTDSSQEVSIGTLNIPVYLRIGLPLGFSAELGVEASSFLTNNEDVGNDLQGLALFGLSWHPIDAIRIGARFQPSFSPLEINGIEDVGLNVSHFYVAWIIL